MSTRIGIIGDFNPNNPTHLFTNSGLKHAGEALGSRLDVVWLATDRSHDLAEYQGLFCSPGSPDKDMDAALNAIRYSREKNVPLIGTCGGFQHMVIEYARNVMGIKDAAHAESDPYASCLFITPLSCSLVGMTMDVTIQPGTKAASACGITSAEQFYCNFGLNPEYQDILEAAGLQITGKDQWRSAHR